MATVTIDNDTAGYSSVGFGNNFNQGGINNNWDYDSAGSGGSSATWNFGTLTGTYTVEIHWCVASPAFRASNAPYTVKSFVSKTGVPSVGGAVTGVTDGVDETGASDSSSITVKINQSKEANGTQNTGDNYSSGWLSLGDYTVSAAQLKVILTNNSDNYTVADAVRITDVVSGTNASVTQVAAMVTASGGTQTVVSVSSAAIAQVAASVTATGGTQTVAAARQVAISQLTGSVTASGGTHVVATVNNASITQVAATVSATGGTQVVTTSQFTTVAQVAATVTGTGGTQVVTAARMVSISQVAANVVAAGGTQLVVANAAGSVSIFQIAATVTANGGTQAIATVNNISIAQLTANVTAAGGTQRVSAGTSSTTGQVKVKINDLFVVKPIKAKIGGSFTTKPMKHKSGSFIATSY